MVAEAIATVGFSDDASRRLREWLNQRCGMYFSDQKSEVLHQRLARVMTEFSIPTLEVLTQELERARNPEILAAVVDAASTNHTYFFREQQVLDYLRDNVLAPRAGESVRIWSAASSTGDEAYSCAIIASELYGRRAARESVSILGTDINSTVLETAEAGLYGPVNLEHTSPDLLSRYFVEEEPGNWRVVRDIREMCLFRRLNLKTTPYPFKQKFHVVLCRNVLYYFDLQTQREVAEAIYDVTEPGGYLLTSVTVSIRELGTRWSMVQSGVYRKPS